MTRELCLVALASMLSTGCGPRPDPPPPAVTPPVAAAPPPAVERPDLQLASPEAQRTSALLSLYYYARIAEGFDAPAPSDNPALEPMRLEEAAAILRDDDSMAGDFRQEQVIVRLAASGLENQAIQQALQTLGADLPLLKGALQDHPDADLRARALLVQAALRQARSGGASLHHPGATLHGRALVVQAELREVGWTPGCEATSYFTGVSKSAKGATYAKTMFKVNRGLAGLAPVMDPQNWDLSDAGCSDYFVAAYIAKKGSNGYDHDANCDVSETPGKAAGYDWDDVLFEHYGFSPTPGASTWFKNLLKVTSDRDPNEALSPTSYHMTYDLEQSICSQVGTDMRPGGIAIDRGYAHAKVLAHRPGEADPTKEFVDVVATKELLLSPRPGAKPAIDVYKLNFWVSVYLTAFGDAIARHACCVLDLTPPG